MIKRPRITAISFQELMSATRKLLEGELLRPIEGKFIGIDKNYHRSVQLRDIGYTVYMRLVSIDKKAVRDLWIDLESPSQGRGLVGKIIAVKSWLDLYYSPSRISFANTPEEFRDILQAVNEFFQYHSTSEKFVFQDWNFIDLVLDVIPERQLEFKPLSEFKQPERLKILRTRRSSGLYNEDKEVDRYDIVEQRLFACRSSYLEEEMKKSLPVKLDVWELRTLLGILMIATGGLDGVHRTQEEIRDMVWKNKFEVECSRMELLLSIGIGRSRFLNYPLQKQIWLTNRLEKALWNLFGINVCVEIPGKSIRCFRLLQELGMVKRGKGYPVMYQIVPATRFFKDDFLRRFLIITPEMRKLMLRWSKMADARFYFWLNSKVRDVVNPKNRVSVKILLKAIKWERRLKQWGRPKTVKEMEKMFEKFQENHFLLSWEGDGDRGYRFFKNKEAFGEMKAKRLAHRLIAHKTLEMFEEEKE